MSTGPTSFWLETTAAPSRPALSGQLDADIAVVGGGITGITTAALLTRAGYRVAVLEAARIGIEETFKTAAHLTEVLDVPYHVLLSRFGDAGAKLAAEGHRSAIDRIAEFAHDLALPCDFRRLPGFLFTEHLHEVQAIDREAAAVERLGLRAALTNEVPSRSHAGEACDSTIRRHFTPAFI
jgi:glycine/D-amino acid oxidase-like deaminating enzyme